MPGLRNIPISHRLWLILLNARSIASPLAQVVEDINQNVTRAASLAHENALAADRSNEASLELGQLAGRLNRLSGQFRV